MHDNTEISFMMLLSLQMLVVCYCFGFHKLHLLLKIPNTKG